MGVTFADGNVGAWFNRFLFDCGWTEWFAKFMPATTIVPSSFGTDIIT